MFSNRQNARFLHTIQQAQNELRRVYDRYRSASHNQLTQNERYAADQLIAAIIRLDDAITGVKLQLKKNAETDTEPPVGNDAGEAL